MRTINAIAELPDLSEMIESLRTDHVHADDAVDAIVERIREDWDCRIRDIHLVPAIRGRVYAAYAR